VSPNIGVGTRWKTTRRVIPTRFWMLVAGELIISSGSSMVWPFLSGYLKDRLGVPLTVIAFLLTLNSIMEILFSFVAGSLTDRFGRKSMMVFSLFSGSLYYLLMGQPGSLVYYAVLLAFGGATDPLYTVGLNTIVADMVPEEYRPDAYSFIRIAHNVGVVIGPILGGLLVVAFFNASFFGAAMAFLLLAVAILFILPETRKKTGHPEEKIKTKETFAGYRVIFKDRVFLGVVLGFTFSLMAASLVFILLQVYTREQFGMPEDQFGYVIAINALMVILFQYFITNFTQKRKPLPVLAVGALFYAVGVGSVALGKGFWGFALSVAIMTMGELIITPTGTSLVASLAPAELRGRYMGVYNLVWPVASGLGPILGGLLYDNISPGSMWLGGFTFGIASALVFLWVWLNNPDRQVQTASTAS